MSDGYKQGLHNEEVDALESALIRFCDKHPMGNPGLKLQIEEAAGVVKLAMEKTPDGPSAIVGAAMALKEFIRTHRMNKMRI